MTFLSSPLRHFIPLSVALFMVGGATAQSEVKDIAVSYTHLTLPTKA